jgi:predicted aldo/keto reductase-like oxidoreductase
MKQNEELNRRSFLKTIGAAGLGSVLASSQALSGPNEPNIVEPSAKQKPEYPQVPKRQLGKLTCPGKSGPEPLMVSSLALGTMFDTVTNQMALRESLKHGVTYWDTAHSYTGGNSEIGIGKFLSRNPGLREKLFIVTKASRAKSIEEVESRLLESLQKLKTDYIDLYYGVHILTDPAGLTDELRKWAEGAKKRKLIRYFGFSTHENMAACLEAASKLDWIDAILVLYNFRVMQDPELQQAIQVCYEAGVGLTAMKTQARGQAIETEGDKKLTDHFIKRGFTAAQAKIKVILDDKRISSVAVGRGNVRELRENIAVALDRTSLTATDVEVFRQVADQTCTGYCAGCAHICSAAVPDTPQINDVMRYLMYYNSYGERRQAKELFAQIPQHVRQRLAATDYSPAEARCPQHLPIGKLMAEALQKLA